MVRRVAGNARLARGLVVAASGATLALAGHVVGGGALPVHPTLLFPLAVAAAACVALSDREWSFARLLVALGGVEALVHLTLLLGHASAHASGSARVGSIVSTSSSGPDAVRMLLGHALVAAVTAWLLRCGEALFWRVWSALRWTSPRPLGAVRVLEPSRPLPPGAPTLVERLVMASAVSWRGPPVATA